MPIHVVAPGDTVHSIARQYGVSAQRILSDNGLLSPWNLPVGQALLVLIPQVIYTVRPGDTLYSIAAKFSISEITLLQNNPSLIDAPFLPVGRSIVIAFQDGPNREITVNGYAYPSIRRDVLRRALPYLTYLTIFGYGFTEDGTLIPIDDEPLIRLAYEFYTVPVLLLSSITGDGNFSGELASRLFQDSILQNKVIAALIDVMHRKGYRGLDVDFEYISPQDAHAFQGFLANISAQMHAAGFFVNVDLAPKTSAAQRGLLYEAHDYAALSAPADTVLLMTYEWGYTYGPPMAVAPIDKVRQVVEYAVTEIPPEKILLGLPNYGYDWALPFERGITRATSIGNQYAAELAGKYGAEIQFDPVAKSPHFEYRSPLGVNHVVWFEDVRSMNARFDLVDEFALLGGGYWNLMRPFNQNWGLLASRYTIRKLV